MTLVVPGNANAPYVPTVNYLPEDQVQRVIRQQELYNQHAQAINIREIANYENVELLTGQIWRTNAITLQPTFRIVFDIGAIAAGVTGTAIHGLTFTKITKLDCIIQTDVPDNRQVVWTDVTVVTTAAALSVTPTQIILQNGAAAPNILSGTLVLEYLKN